MFHSIRGRRLASLSSGLVAALAIPLGCVPATPPPPLLLPAGGSPSTGGAVCPTPPTYTGSDAYRHFDKLSYLNLQGRMASASTADPNGTNVDDVHVLRTLANGAKVLLDQVGPTVATFLRMQQSTGAPWTLGVDGQPRAVVAAGDLGNAGATGFPSSALPYPLSLNPQQTPGSSILAAALPASQGLRWSSAGPNGNFYGLFRKLPFGTPVPSWTGGEPTADVAAQLKRAGTDISPAGLPVRAGTVAPAAGQETTLTTLTGGPSQLRAVQLHVPDNEKVRTGNSRLRIYWDGETTPSVDAPLKFLVGDGAGVYQPAGRPLVAGYPSGAGSDGHGYFDYSLYWPMPFHHSARITLTPQSTAATLTNIGWRVRAEAFPDPACWWGTFHATYTAVPHPTPGADMTFLDVGGSGRIVGTVVNFNRVGPTLEGDPRFYLDGSSSPQVQATGTEEWGLGGDYWNYFSGTGRQVSLPLGGLPSNTDNPPGADVDGAALYRFLIADSIPFNSSATLRWEHGGLDGSTEPYRAAVLYYGTPTPTVVQSDVLHVGDPTSRTAHGYQSPAGRPYTLTAAFPYTVHAAASTDTGIATTGTSTFSLALDPRNVGAFLRRKLDYGVADQRADVSIDGHPAGTWYTAGSVTGTDPAGIQRRWLEDEFPLPPSLTAGKSKVLVTVHAIPTTDPPDTGWTESTYQSYSVVAPPAS